MALEVSTNVQYKVVDLLRSIIHKYGPQNVIRTMQYFDRLHEVILAIYARFVAKLSSTSNVWKPVFA